MSMEHPTHDILMDEEDDDDIDYEPPTEATDDDDDDDDDDELLDVDEDGGEYIDEDILSGVDIEFTMDADDHNVEGEGPSDNGLAQGEAATERPTTRITGQELLQLFGGRGGLGRLLVQQISRSRRSAPVDDDDNDNDDGDEDDGITESMGGYGTRRRRRRKSKPAGSYPTVPSEEGQELMNSGTFGSPESCRTEHAKEKPKLGSRLMRRELGLTQAGMRGTNNKLMAQGLLPSSKADMIVHYDAKCYSGQFSDDGNFFFSCAQDFRVRMYDTSNPYRWTYYKTVTYPYGQWTITDATLSPDNKYLAYSSIRSLVCLAPTDPNDTSEPWLLNFADMGRQRSQRPHAWNSFGIWSLRFSGDGREIVAGTNDNSVYVFDLEKSQAILRIPGHDEDVNAVCYGDKMSPHILYSGSDDSTLKVWDRRSMGDSREAGVFLGHTEGLTYVDSKGDGRYVLSNAKDQTMKLWDLRKMMSTDRAKDIDPLKYCGGWDYRFEERYNDEDFEPHPFDNSVVTFRGHRVIKTLIRCHFSPPGSTDSRYVYTGSHDGSVYIYNMDATLAGKVDVRSATEGSRPRDSALYPSEFEVWGIGGGRGSWSTCVRDVSWHPNAPVMAATSWNGWGMSTGTCTVHSWNDNGEDDEADPQMGVRVNDVLEEDEALQDSPAPRTRSQARFPRTRG
ncbi:MAG: hypothetical protein M1833_000725 [Piccolia ochrophora]|nr:MAG: hypothetical protein M1833_000725 [Piccolia ochrophora]